MRATRERYAEVFARWCFIAYEFMDELHNPVFLLVVSEHKQFVGYD